MNDGWTYGELRDDAGKHHPCLVPYDELNETERNMIATRLRKRLS